MLLKMTKPNQTKLMNNFNIKKHMKILYNVKQINKK